MKLSILNIIIIMNVFSIADAAQWALRARENYEFKSISNSEANQDFSGLSSTINLYREVPYDISYGLSFSPPLAELKSSGSDNLFGRKIKSWDLGPDIKFFPWEGIKIFIRGGLAYQFINFNSTRPNISGPSILFGLGAEFLAFDTFSVAPEIAFRQAFMSDDFKVNTISISLGLHFYSLAKQ